MNKEKKRNNIIKPMTKDINKFTKKTYPGLPTTELKS